MFVLFAGALWFGAAWRIPPVLQQRTELKLEMAPVSEDIIKETGLRLPLEAMSIFRPLVIDYLWISLENLKQAGQYFDANYRARAICKLQPNLANVWDFQAWNMAYNISVATPRPEQRWEWVKRGIELLRDEGIPANPHSSLLHDRLAWIYLHKCSGISDDYHRYYKLQFMGELDTILSPVTNEELQALADSPRHWETLLKDDAVAAVMEQLRRAGTLKEDQQILRRIWDYRSRPVAWPDDYAPILSDPANKDAWRWLDLFLRARELRDTWKMDPVRMIEINQKYGPVDLEGNDESVHQSLDWRHPLALAIYWAQRGLDVADINSDFDRLQLQRKIYYALQDLFKMGSTQIFYGVRMVEERDLTPGREILDKPERLAIEIFENQDLRMFPQAYQSTLDIIEWWKRADSTKVESVTNGSINLLTDGILRLYLAGYKSWAEKYLRDGLKRYPDREFFQSITTLDQFVQRELRKQVKDITSTFGRGYIDSLLRQSLMQYALGNDTNATISENWARQLHEMVKNETEATGRLDLPEYSVMRREAFDRFFSDPYMGSEVKLRMQRRLSVEQPEILEWLQAQWNERRNEKNGSQTTP